MSQLHRGAVELSTVAWAESVRTMGERTRPSGAVACVKRGRLPAALVPPTRQEGAQPLSLMRRVNSS